MTTTTSCGRWCGWIVPGFDLEQADKIARLYRHFSLTRKWMHRLSSQVPRVARHQVWTDHTGTRLSMQCPRTPIFARMETTIARDGPVAIPGGFSIPDDSQEELEEDEVPQILLQGRPAFRHPWYRVARGCINTTQKSRGTHVTEIGDHA